MGAPSSNSGNREQHGKEVGGNAQSLVDDSRVEVYVGVELSLNEVLVTKSDSLQLDGDFNQRRLSDNRENFISGSLDDLGSGIVTLVDSVSESHKHLFAVLDVLNELRNVFFGADLLEHAEDGFVGSSVAGSVESSHCSGEAGVHISLAGSHVSNGGGGAVELVLGVENEQNIESLHDFRVNSVVGVSGLLIHHVHEVFNIAKVLLGLGKLLAELVTIAVGSQGGGRSNQSVDVLISLLLQVVDLGAVEGRVSLWVERGHSSNEGRHHSHGVSIMAESLDELVEIVIVGGVLHDFSLKVSRLFLAGQFSEDQEEGGLQEGALLSELFDGDASVFEDTFVTIDEGYSGYAVHGIHIGWVERSSDISCSVLDFSEVGGVDSTVLDGQGVLFSGSVVLNRESIVLIVFCGRV